MTELWLFLHFAAVVVWIGGMVFAHFCLRPAALATLQPPQRLPLMAAALGRFFACCSGAAGWRCSRPWQRRAAGRRCRGT